MKFTALTGRNTNKMVTPQDFKIAGTGFNGNPVYETLYTNVLPPSDIPEVGASVTRQESAYNSAYWRMRPLYGLKRRGPLGQRYIIFAPHSNNPIDLQDLCNKINSSL